MTVKAQRRGRASNIAVGTGRVVRRGHVNTAHNDVTQTEVDAVAGDVSAVEADLAALTAVVAGILPVDLATADVTGDLPLANIAQIATARILGRNTAGNGDIEVLTTLPSAVQDLITRLGTVVAGQFGNTALKALDTGGDHTVTVKVNENNAADRVLNVEMGDADRTVELGQPDTWVPTWTNSLAGATDIGNGSLSGRTSQIGKLVFFTFHLSYGSTTDGGGGGAGGWSFSLPTSIQAATLALHICAVTAAINDSSTNTWYLGTATSTAANTIGILLDQVVGTLGPANPFTFATSDQIIVRGCYWQA